MIIEDIGNCVFASGLFYYCEDNLVFEKVHEVIDSIKIFKRSIDNMEAFRYIIII